MILFVGGAACVHASPIVVSTSFDEVIITGTDTFETAGGSVISTLQYVAFSDELPSDIAADLINQSWAPSPYSADISRILASLPQATLTDDLTFLTTQLPNVYIPSVGPTLIGQPANISDISGLYPEFPVVFSSPATIGVVSYSTGAFESSTTIIDGTVTFDIYEVDYVQQQSSAIPEPASYLYVLFGAVLIAVRQIGQNPRSYETGYNPLA
ncbi:MAG: hypothetical protein ABSF22_24725 [Bryobacteraceae bacterium]|jgi:hypothetical protein